MIIAGCRGLKLTLETLSCPRLCVHSILFSRPPIILADWREQKADILKVSELQRKKLGSEDGRMKGGSSCHERPLRIAPRLNESINGLYEPLSVT